MAAFRLRQARASSRQEAIQLYCCEELAARGVPNTAIERRIEGSYRSKKWDVVATAADGEPRVAISCKSIISNHGGTVPNRIDDMLGEAVNVHRRWPRAVLGYLFMMSRVDESQAMLKTRARHVRAGRSNADIYARDIASGRTWFERLGDSVSRAAGRADAADVPERFEAVSCSLVGFEEGPPYPIEYHPATLTPDAFFDALARLYVERYP